MLFDPDDGKTWPEKIEAVLDRMHPVYRETVTELAQLRGCSVLDIVEECVHLWLDDMEDPPIARLSVPRRRGRRPPLDAIRWS